LKKIALCMILLQTVLVLSSPDSVYADKTPDDRAHCKVWWAVVKDPDPPLNMRSSPEVRPDNIVATLENGIKLSVLEESEEWFRVAAGSGTPGGWVVKNRTDYECGTFTEQITSFPAVIKGRLVWGGSHSYVFQLEKGQTLVMKPVGDSQYPLEFFGHGGGFGGMANDGPTRKNFPDSWAWTVTETGEYRLAYVAFKGTYSYELVLEVR